MSSPSNRPVYLDLRRWRWPVTAVVSLAHRASGVMLFVALAPALWLLQQSLSGEQGYAAVQIILSTEIARLSAAALVWALVHHALAGIRLLLLDVHVGLDLRYARLSSHIVNGLGLGVFLIAIALTW